MGYKGKTTPADLQRQTKNARVEMFKALHEAHMHRKENAQLRETLKVIEKQCYNEGSYLEIAKIASEALRGEHN